MEAFKIEYLPWWLYLAGLGLILVPLGVMELAKALGFIEHHTEADENSFAAKLERKLAPTVERIKGTVLKTIENVKNRFVK
jgi:hypothetical protein